MSNINLLDSATCFAPATIANVGPGFDAFGLAVEVIDRSNSEMPLGDVISIEVVDHVNNKQNIDFSISGNEAAKSLPKDPELNSATLPLIKFRAKLNSNVPIKVHLKKGLPLGSGLGSSAASSAAALLAMNKLYGNPFTLEELVTFALEGEFVASGARHADNVAPAILGSITVIKSTDPLIVTRIEAPEDLRISLIHPNVVIKTSDARKVLPNTYEREIVVKQISSIASLITALCTSNYDLLRYSLEDFIATPYRSKLIPNYKEAQKTAIECGALGFGISGSGPSLFAFTKSNEEAYQVTSSVVKVFEDRGIKASGYVCKVKTD